MEYRQLGRSGFTVPVLSFGTGTFGGGTEFFKAWGSTDAKGATRLVDICLDAGISMFDSADVYSKGLAEEVLGAAIKGRRNKVIISTKATFRFSDRPNDVGSSRAHLTEAINGSLKRLGTDYIDLFQLHGFDAMTPQEEVMGCLDDFVRAGKIRYTGCSNFSGWHLMKSLATSEKLGSTAMWRTRPIIRWWAAPMNGNSCRWASTRAWALWCGARLAGAGLQEKSAAAPACPRKAASM